MSIIISSISLPVGENEQTAINEAFRICGTPYKYGMASIYRKSIDARRGNIKIVYSVLIDGLDNEKELADKNQNIRIKIEAMEPEVTGDKKLDHRPVVIGFGPAGLFTAYILAKNGFNPIVLERGSSIDQRDKDVDEFFSGGNFKTECNIQFGEGGAGTYSDGKLTTRINDPFSELVLKYLVENGAPDEILKQAKPHIGTDILKNVVKNMRKQIIQLGGEVHFDAKLTGINVKNNKLCSVLVNGQDLACDIAVLAIGHSARDTFYQIRENGVYFEPKPFSVGARIEHLQSELNKSLYGKMHNILPPAEYTLSYRNNNRACYSFCMCPGGLVVAAQSEENTIVTNGMSYHARDGKNANSAIVVSVNTSDFNSSDALAGIEFQRKIEQSAYECTNSYKAPCQTVGDFLKTGKSKGSVSPSYPRGVEYGDISACLPNFVTEEMKDGLKVFGRKIKGFDCNDALLTAPETRTSSPVRITRNDELYNIGIQGLIPCGEGAGYAGGIVSAAVDGIRAASRIMGEFRG